MSPSTSEVVALVAARPRLPVAYMALLLGMDAGELELRLLAAAAAGLVVEAVEGSCCGGSLFEVTAVGEQALSQFDHRIRAVS